MPLNFTSPTSGQDASSFLQPALPALLLGSQLASGLRNYRVGRSVTEFKPVASSSGNDISGSNNVTNSSKDSTPTAPSSGDAGWAIRLPKPSFTGAFIGIGAGGAIIGGKPGKAVALWPFSSKSGSTASKKEKKRILIMMSNTGGGHRASAEAIRDAMKEKYGDDYEVLIVDMWKEHTPPPFKQMPDTYAFMVKHSILWRLSYEITQPKAFHIPYLAFCGVFMRQGLNKAFDKYQPDLVVSVHPLMQHVPIGILRKRIQEGKMPGINFATVVTDFTTCHNTWFHPGTTRCFVPTEYCAMLGRKNGLSDDQLIMHGLPIRPVFSKQLPDRKSLRKTLDINTSLPTVLLVGGGEGMGALEETVSQLDQQLGRQGQVVVICGRNKQLLAKLSTKQQPNGLSVKACGFVDNIHEWMAASDAIITKAGPGTIAEALISGLPILLNGNIPCQEEGNIPYVIDNGVGDFETKPDKIAELVKTWLAQDDHHKKHLKDMAAKSKALGRPEAVYQIAADLADLARNVDYKYGPASVLAGKNGLPVQKLVAA